MKTILLFLLVLITVVCFGQKNVEKAHKLFETANSRMKVMKDEIDSVMIYQSITDYTEAIQLYPEFWHAYRNRSRWYGRTGQFQKAVDDLTIALRYADSSNAIDLYDMRAYWYYDLKQYKMAINDWTIAIEHLGNASFALLSRAKAEYMLGQKDTACADYKKAVLLNGNLKEQTEFKFCE